MDDWEHLSGKGGQREDIRVEILVGHAREGGFDGVR